jgi:uncharacterized membrane protein
MVEVVRLTTVHPALVHFTIGALPVIVVGYAVAARTRSERWTFAADLALVLTAALTIATAVSGLVANALVPWPGGLALWRWLHLGFGVASAVLLLGFAAARLWRRRRRSGASGTATLACALAITLVVGFTGWIGGEVLVFRSGIAVRAAGEGALAPPVVRAKKPKDLVDAMDRLRAAWASAETTTSTMIVQEPRERDFATIEGDARQMTTLARWIAAEGPAWMPNASAPSEHHADPEDPADHAHQHAHEHHAHPDHGHAAMTVGQHLTLMARDLAAQAVALEQAAHARDVTKTVRLVGDIQTQCAGCHRELRWATSPVPQALR